MPQNLEGAAKEATTPQQFGDEFKQPTHEHLNQLIDRLHQLEHENSVRMAKMWSNKAWDKDGVYIGPQWLEQEKLDREMAVTDREIVELKRQLSPLLEVLI